MRLQLRLLLWARLLGVARKVNGEVAAGGAGGGGQREESSSGGRSIGER